MVHLGTENPSLEIFCKIETKRKNRSFFLYGCLYTLVTPASEEDYIRQHPDILLIRELVGIYEITIRDVEVPLKIKIMRSGSEYYGIPNLVVREKGAKDYYRDSRTYSSKEAAFRGVVEGFFLHLLPGASIREIKNWGI